jgi:LIM-domain binding protein
MQLIIWNCKRDDRKTIFIPTGLIPRFFAHQYENSVEQMSFAFDGYLSTEPLGQNRQSLSQNSRWLSWFKDGSQVCTYSINESMLTFKVVWTGQLKATSIGDKLESLSFVTDKHENYISRTKLEELVALSSPPPTKSPKITKNQGTKKGNAKNQLLERTLVLPESQFNDYGISHHTMIWLEVCTVLCFDITNLYRCASQCTGCKIS